MIPPRFLSRLALPGVFLTLVFGIGFADDEGDSSTETTSPADSAATDSTAANREFLSTDGAISVYEEARPGEGIDGFWWEYDPEKDLERLTDVDRLSDLLDPLVDGFGFELAIPESIRALRDSVSAVADSILAERVQIETNFDPRIKSEYKEAKDVFTLKNNLNTAIPMTTRGSVNASLDDSFEFTESTGRELERRTLSTNFTYRLTSKTNASLVLSRTESDQKLNGIVSNETTNTSVTGSLKNTKRKVAGFNMDTSVGFVANSRDYLTQSTDGANGAFQPNWGAKLTRALPEGGTLSFNYKGSYQRSSREELRTLVEDGVEIQRDTEASENNFVTDLTSTYKQKFSDAVDIDMNGRFQRNRFQFLPQADSLLGQTETRITDNRSVKSTVNAKVLGLTIRANGEVARAATEYNLQTLLTTINNILKGQVDITVHPWTGAKVVTKIEREREDRDRNTIQAGIVNHTVGSVDLKQRITENVEFDATYFTRLDRFAFDDPDSNKTDRDLLNQRTTFNLRYSPALTLSSGLKMELRKLESINIHRTRSGDNKTDYTFVIRPDYKYTRGSATFTGDVTADVRYAVFDTDEEENDVVRRFSTTHKWQQEYTKTLSSSVLYSFELNDQGGYQRSSVDGVRRFSKISELRRSQFTGELIYKPVQGTQFNAKYRQDVDRTFSIDGEERDLSNLRRTYEFTWGFTTKRSLSRHISLNLRLSQTRRSGDLVPRVDRQFANIVASVEYQPFKKKKKEGASS